MKNLGSLLTNQLFRSTVSRDHGNNFSGRPGRASASVTSNRRTRRIRHPQSPADQPPTASAGDQSAYRASRQQARRHLPQIRQCLPREGSKLILRAAQLVWNT